MLTEGVREGHTSSGTCLGRDQKILSLAEAQRAQRKDKSRTPSGQRCGAIGHPKVQVISCRFHSFLYMRNSCHARTSPSRRGKLVSLSRDGRRTPSKKPAQQGRTASQAQVEPHDDRECSPWSFMIFMLNFTITYNIDA